MSAKRTTLLLILALVCILNLMAQDTSLEVFIHDNFTEKPLESVLVSVLRYGAVIDSAYTDIHGIANINIPATGVREPEGLPSSITLSHNYPNPFRDDTNVEIGIPEAQTIRATVYNVLGQRVASEEIPVSAGYYTLKLSLSHLPTGVYFLRIEGKESQAVKLLKMGSGVYRSGPLFSISQIGGPDLTTLDKIAAAEFTIRAEKDRYDVYETSITIPGNSDVTIPLARNNMVEFIVVDDDERSVSIDLQLKNGDYQTVITTPYTVTLKSGMYNVMGGVSIHRTVEIPSVDTTIVLSDNNAVTDIDGSVYQIVKIGDQWWMAENLRTTKYADGTDIPRLSNSGGENTTSGAYAVYPHEDVDGINSDEEMLAAYGALYNWYAVNDSRGLCPTGWHVPGDEEWEVLVNYLGGEFAAGGKLKSTRTDPDLHPRWHSPNEGATDESGWSGLPGGIRFYEHFLGSNFAGIGGIGYWWSSTEVSTTNALRYRLNYYTKEVQRSNTDNLLGFSVRCMRSADISETFTISGRITEDGSGLGGVTIMATGGRSQTVTTNSNGEYIITGVPRGAHVTITPILVDYSFSPRSRSIENITQDVTGVDFAAVSESDFEIGEKTVTSFNFPPSEIGELEVGDHTFRFPEGGSGEIVTAPILSSPDTPWPDGYGLYLEYEGTSTVELVLPGADDGSMDYPMLFVYAQVDGSYSDNIYNQPRWQGIPYRILTTDRMAFVLYPSEIFDQQSDTNQSSALKNTQRHADNWYIARIRPTTDAFFSLLEIEAQAKVYHEFFLNQLQPARKNTVEQHMKDYPLNISVVEKNGQDAYTGFWWLMALKTKAKPIITLSKVNARQSFPHEIGHYYTHLLMGDERYYQLEKQISISSTSHTIGIYIGRNNIIEEYAYYIDFALTGRPEPRSRAAYHRTQDFHLNVHASAPNRDYPGIEGFGAHMLAALTNPNTKVHSPLQMEEVDVPVIGLSESAVYEKIARGATNINSLREEISGPMTGRTRTAFQVHLQRLGWNYGVIGRFMDTEGKPVATKADKNLRNFVTVDDTEYEGGWGFASDNEGRFRLRSVFGGESKIRITLDDNREIDLNLPYIDWYKLTTDVMDVGDIIICPPTIEFHGIEYQTIPIGDHCWMAENLRTTRYRDGSSIPNVTGHEEWSSLTTGAWAYYGNNPSNNVTYGKLYNWFAVVDSRGLCPVGWRVPSDNDWTILANYLGGASVAGGKLKSTRIEPDPHPRWDSPNTGATNESGWSGLPGGNRAIAGTSRFFLIGRIGFWWSSTEVDNNDAWGRSLQYNNNIFSRGYAGQAPGYENIISKGDGYSVRCLMD